MAKQTHALTGVLVALALSSGSALAADPGPTARGEYVVDKAEDGRKEGWIPGASVGVSFQLSDSRSVIGQLDGTSILLFANMAGALEYNKEKHQWRGALNAVAGAAQTPALDEFIKARDELTFDTTYLYHAVPTFGPFVRFAANTQMLNGTDSRPVPTTYAITHVDGSVEQLFGGHLHLTDPFQPLSLRQSVGAFWQPLNNDRVHLELKAGLGAAEGVADGQLALKDNADTPETEVTELHDYAALGAEGILNVWGHFDAGKKVSYTVGVNVLTPFVVDASEATKDKSPPSLTNVEFNAGISATLFDWGSLDYKLAVQRKPLLIDAIQVSNTLALTLKLDYGSMAPTPPPPPPKCEPAP